MLKKTLIVLLAGAMITGVVLTVVAVAAPTANAEGCGLDRRGRATGESKGRGWAANNGTRAECGPQAYSENGDCKARVPTAQGKNQGASGREGRAGQQFSGRPSQQQPNGSTVPQKRGSGRDGNASRQDQPADPVDSATYEGTVTASDEHIVLELPNGSELELGLGPTFYREELGFAPELGDHLGVTGFHEDGEFKVLTIVDQDEITHAFRDEYGRPMWAGRGRGSL